MRMTRSPSAPAAPDPDPGGFSRRRFLHAAALGATGLALAACAPATTPTPGNTGSAPSGTTPAPTGTTPAPTGTASGSASAPPPQGSLRERIARLLVVGFRGLTVGPDDWIARAIVEQGLGGVILFDRHQRAGRVRNVESPGQVTQLIADLRALAPARELIVAIDQEGGHVTRLSPAYGFPKVTSEAAIGEAGDTAVQAWADGLAGTLAEVGVNLNLAPVVDLDVNPDNPAVGAIDRAFSADSAVVARDAAIEMRAHRARGVRTTLKHFPGLGSATVNTDYGVADVTSTWTPIELQPYRDLLGLGLVDVVMAAHVVNGQIDPNAPASLSAATVTGLLRGTLGWDGLVVTDDLGAAAITDAFGFDDAITLALDAGVDLLLIANQQHYDPKVVTRIVDLLERLIGEGRITESRINESVVRVERLFPSVAAASG
jgi:beta-N-acetylhexosaminidase